MKKRFVSLLSLLLALCLLSGCAFPGLGRRDDAEHVPFSEMVYSRPDRSEMDALLEELEALLDGDAPYREVEEKLDECFDWYYHFYTMNALAQVHSYLDLTDEYYAYEYEWISEEYALVQQTFDKLYYACAGSKLGEKLEQDYFWEGFLEEYSDPEDSIYSDEYVAMLQEESDLIARYHDIIAEPTVEYDGEERIVDELLSELIDRGDAQGYYGALEAYSTKYSDALGDIFIKLVKVRKAMAEHLEYDSYEQMQYEFSYERSFTPEQAADYLGWIEQDLVPFYTELQESGLQDDVWYGDVSEEELYDILKTVSGEMGSYVSAAFKFMDKYGLYDITSSTKKADASFETYFPDYEEPFVFLGADRTSRDVLSFAHEFGHFCDAYVNEGALNESIDLAEVYSQAMELLALSRLGDTMDEDEVANIAHLKVLDMAEMYVEQCSFAEFESRVYALSDEELSVEAINAIMLEEAEKFGYAFPGFEWYFSRIWFEIMHFFEAPFYVISYPISNDMAMQIYALELQGREKGKKKYLSVLEHDYVGIMDLVEEGGLDTPFSAESVARTVETMRSMTE